MFQCFGLDAETVLAGLREGLASYLSSTPCLFRFFSHSPLVSKRFQLGHVVYVGTLVDDKVSKPGSVVMKAMAKGTELRID